MIVTNKIFQLNRLDDALNNAIQSSFIGSGVDSADPHFWATTKLKDSVEKAMNGWAAQNKANNMMSGQIGPGDPPIGSGFKVIFGLQIQLSYKVRFKTNVDLGYGFRKGNFAGTGSAHIAAYNGGLGVGVGKNNLVFDVTAAVNVTVGGGHGPPLQSYSLNYNSPIPMLNDFKRSLSYGQALTWNSALNQNQFSLDKIQREGMIGFRVWNVNASSNNDTKRIYKGDGGDKGWTGGFTLATPFMEVGFQDFTGDYKINKLDEKRQRIKDQIQLVEKSYLNNVEKKIILDGLNADLKKLVDGQFHEQTPSQKNLNKASTYFRFNNNGNMTTIDLIGDAWLQNFIHKQIKDFKFQYDHKKTETWVGF